MPNGIKADADGRDWALYLGGPDKTPGRLRDVLAAKIDAQSAGDEIIWATYYFCDIDLAQRLMIAHDRGVGVTLVVQEKPRFKSANQPVINLLKAHPIWESVQLYNPSGKLSGNLHSKIYVFRGERNSALIGSFNPSADGAGNAKLLEEIGDQDRGYNLLLEIFDENIVQGLARLAVDITAQNGRFSRRFRWRAIASECGKVTRFPQVWPLRGLKGSIVSKPSPGQSCEIRIAASHVKGRLLPILLRKVLQSDRSRIKLLTHHTERRAPEATLDRFRRAGAKVRRYQSADKLPMHAKFILRETSVGKKYVRLGSLNYNQKSLWLNDELIFDSEDPNLYEALKHWFDQIWTRAGQ